MLSNISAKAAAWFLVGSWCSDKKNDYSPLVRELREWVLSDSGRRQSFETGIKTARSYKTLELEDILCLEDFFLFINEQLHWIPSEAVRPKDLLYRCCKMWFVLDQPSIAVYQSPISPSTQLGETGKLSWLSNWMVRFSNEMGEFMDSPDSAAYLDTFRTSPTYNINDYIEPRGGWRTFNEFFCRSVKPGRRPIASIGDDSVLTSPADFEFKEVHPISPSSTITTKGLTWRIAQMLVDSPFRDRFANGTWLHGFLNVNDYHRIHTPVSGVVLEARTIVGQNYMEVSAVSAPAKDESGNSTTHSVLDVPNKTGYQFCQARGLIILDTGVGLAAVLPVGMAMVSSVILTAEVGISLHKGEELGYFQFGGSDVVLIFEDRLKAEITMTPEQHYKMGTEIGRLLGVKIE